jgi:hypothetical protein
VRYPLKVISRIGGAVFLLLLPRLALASCSGLTGQDLVNCQAADSQMRTDYLQRQEAVMAEKVAFQHGSQTLSFTREEIGDDPGNDDGSMTSGAGMRAAVWQRVCAKGRGDGKYTGEDAVFRCKSGKLDGEATLAFADGKPRFKGSFSAGVGTGTHLYFDEAGNKIEEMAFLGGKRTRGKSFDANGQLTRQWEFVGDQPDGEQIEVTNGKTYKTVYKRGKRITP